MESATFVSGLGGAFGMGKKVPRRRGFSPVPERRQRTNSSCSCIQSTNTGTPFFKRVILISIHNLLFATCWICARSNLTRRAGPSFVSTARSMIVAARQSAPRAARTALLRNSAAPSGAVGGRTSIHRWTSFETNPSRRSLSQLYSLDASTKPLPHLRPFPQTRTSDISPLWLAISAQRTFSTAHVLLQQQQQQQKTDDKAESSTGQESKQEEKKQDADQEETSQNGEKEKEKEKQNEDAPPPPPHGDKTPWQVFTSTMSSEFKASKEWNESTKALASSAHQFSESESVKRARSAYEAASDAASTKTSSAFKGTGKALGKGAAWTWDTPVVKGVRYGVSATGTGIEKATRPVRDTKAYKAAVGEVKDVIDDGSSSRYGGWVEKEERRKQKELRELHEAKSGKIHKVEKMEEDPK